MVSKAKLRERFQVRKARVVAQSQRKTAAQREKARIAREDAAREAAAAKQAAEMALFHQRTEDALEAQKQISAAEGHSFSEARKETKRLLRRLAEELLDNPGKPGPKTASSNSHPFLSRREMQTRFRTEVADRDLSQGPVARAIEEPAFDLPRAECPKCGNPKARQEPVMFRTVEGTTTEEHPIRCGKCNPLRKRPRAA